MFEKKWITQDPKSVAFASFVSKASLLLDKLDNDNPKKTNPKKKKNKSKKKNDKLRKDKWKFNVPKEGELKTKVVDGKTFYYCNKPHGQEGKPMWTMCKPSEHKDFKKSKPKTSDAEIKATDELRSLLITFKKDF